MKLKALTAAALALSFIAAPVLSQKARPWGKDVRGRDPDRIWQRIRENPEVQQIRNVLSRHSTWERNNVLSGGQYVADKAILNVRFDDSYFDVRSVDPGRVASPLADANWLFLWPYSEVEAGWGRAKPGEHVQHGSVVVNEGEGQLRFPVYLGPSGAFHEVRLVSYRGKTLLYVMEPGTNRYTEEWILR
jgi:hypothetical protein